MALGSVGWAALWFFAIFLLLVVRNALHRNPVDLATLVVGTLPALMYLRELFFYNSVLVAFGAIVLIWHIAKPEGYRRLWDNLRLRWLLIASAAYWVITLMLTGDYSVNLRILEMSLSAAAIYLLSWHRSSLATAFFGILLSAVSIGLAFLAFGERLGMGEINGVRIGNPITLGLPLTLAFVLALADGGKWLGLEKSPLLRQIAPLAAGGLLLLSTSRASWLIALIALGVLFVLQSERRAMLLRFAVVAVFGVLILLQSERGEYVTHWFDKTVSDDQTIMQKSSGRSDQWMLFPEVFLDSPVWGFGPGSGQSIYAQYSRTSSFVTFQAGKEFMWHSLVMHLGVETGIIGLTVLFLIVGGLAVQGFKHHRYCGEVAPLLGAVAYLTIAMTVTAMDANSGAFLGLGFLSYLKTPENNANTFAGKFSSRTTKVWRG
ncbi:MAG TPA: O-antigen ligase family protein [Candidatus Binatia bacterium]|jgi:hypothetical protein|nr:O-antigen ligase family protein [Candidatus Binatia bacterium]